jgi:drug/metabolite transporter (DMT)-like permease
MDQYSHLTQSIFWMLGAMISFTLMAVSGRELFSSLDTFEIMLYRSLAGILLVLSFGKYFKTLHQIRVENLSLHFIRNISHFGGQNFWFYAIALIPFSQLFAFEFSTPLFIVFLAPIFLGELLTKEKLIAAAIGFLGIMLVARPDLNTISWALIAAFLLPVCFAATAIATKLLTRKFSLTCILFWLVIMQTVFSLICAGYDFNIRIPAQTDLPFLLIVSVTGLTAHLCMTKAFSLAPVSVVMPIDFVRLPLISMVGFLFYNEVLTWYIILGSALVFVGNYVNIKAEERAKINERVSRS